MRQRDIERLGAEAWNVVGQLENRYLQPTILGNLLREIDPHGLLRPGAPSVPTTPEADEASLRDSPRLAPWPARAPRLIGEPDSLIHD